MKVFLFRHSRYASFKTLQLMTSCKRNFQTHLLTLLETIRLKVSKFDKHEYDTHSAQYLRVLV